ncbi:MAG: UDP-N-acetylmuramoyl-L-alanyl-D-glutamate--2,6-diaminopimelate ligase, partial [Lachnospiraceae bacterium]|nr:UDP-N-acetylmuramoyl-L-alanyl-D-glutamate--2,6-diaminopimelate ligase [Lachnospiraceae bacterium]
YNSMTAAAICLELGIPAEKIREALLNAKVRGRVETVPVSDRFTVMVDYAHNAMSLKSLLTTIREYEPKRLVCLFGCGGNRSRDRRFEMGEISSTYADLTVVTTDNPRFEEPAAIMEDIITGVKRADGKYIAIADRQEAIRYCIENAEDGDVIIIAGKGHEDYQEIRGVKHHMDDREMVLACAGTAV